MSNQENFEEAKQERIPFNPSEKPYKKAEIPISLLRYLLRSSKFSISVE